MVLPPLWPGSLPLYGTALTRANRPVPNVLEFPTDEGLGPRRPKQTARVNRETVQLMPLTEAQMETFWAFHDETLKSGNLHFAWLSARGWQIRKVRISGEIEEAAISASQWRLAVPITYVDVTPWFAANLTVANGRIEIVSTPS
ncbi:hypothetical protein HKCCE4037_06405 [Rhodobacterales bacterium HKCCE4037]|nr:hypothetical protein [Rhodobacterales bacterium HKCCE4037]